MTRTERADYPRALNRDRAQSKSGPGGDNIPKGGAGNHNWGTIDDEPRLETDASDDGDAERAAELTELGVSASLEDRVQSKTSTNEITDEDRENARQLRKDAFKEGDGDGIDLAAIARTSAAITVAPLRQDNEK